MRANSTRAKNINVSSMNKIPSSKLIDWIANQYIEDQYKKEEDNMLNSTRANQSICNKALAYRENQKAKEIKKCQKISACTKTTVKKKV